MNETALYVWLQQHGISNYALARELRCDPTSVRRWAEGKTLPDLIGAFKIERCTNGGVPVASWLATELGRQRWESFGVDWGKWRAQCDGAKERWRLKKEGKDGA